jgi:predicted kinase
MATLLIPVGIPGCGKSHWAEAIGTAVVSTDMIREYLTGDVNDQSQNDRVFENFYAAIEKGLLLGNVYADATNLGGMARAELRLIAQRTDATTHLILFRNLEQAIRRNAERERVVPSDVMMRMIEKYERAVTAIQRHERYDYITEVSSVR